MTLPGIIGIATPAGAAGALALGIACGCGASGRGAAATVVMSPPAGAAGSLALGIAGAGGASGSRACGGGAACRSSAATGAISPPGGVGMPTPGAVVLITVPPRSYRPGVNPRLALLVNRGRGNSLGPGRRPGQQQATQRQSCHGDACASFTSQNNPIHASSFSGHAAFPTK